MISKNLECNYCKEKFDSKSRNSKQKYCSKSCARKGSPNNSQFKKGNPSWNKGLNVSGMSGKKMTDVHKDKIRLANTKNDCDCKTEKHYRIRKTKPYYAWVKRVINRDKICVMCECEDKKLHAHHIVSLRENIDLALADDNGAALCNSCHAIIHDFGNYTGKKATLESTGQTYEELQQERL